MNITIIGSGNVGSILQRMLTTAGHEVISIPGRGSLPEFAGSDLIIVAISDDALPALQDRIKLDNQLIVHTAGSVSKDVLKDISDNYGVFYPLQSLRKEMATVPEIPFLIDANTDTSKTILFQLAKNISGNVAYADDEQRLKMHIAAVISSNFSNHLFALAEEYCTKEGLDFSVLLPLLSETVSRLKNNSPALLQTGPAARKDMQTIQKQRDMLVAYPHVSAIYNLLTESIINFRSS